MRRFAQLLSPEAVILGALFIIAVFLRFYLLPQNLFFGPEQGIDFLVMKDIVVNHHPTLIGPKTDISGVFHGPIYYYLASIPFFLSRGDPVFVILCLILLQSLTVFIVYALGKSLVNKNVGLIAAVLFTFSFGAIIHARWLSNPPLSILLATAFFYAIYQFLNGEKSFLYLAAIIFGLLGQVEFLNFVLFSGIVFTIVIMHLPSFKTIRVTEMLFVLCLLFVSSFSNFLLFDLRHSFLITNSIFSLVSGQSGFYVSLNQSFMNSISGYFYSLQQSVSPFFSVISLVVLLFSVFIFFTEKRNRKGHMLVMVWFFIPLILLIFLRHEYLEQFYVGILPAGILLAAIVLERITRKYMFIGIVCIILLIGVNIAGFSSNIFQNKHVYFQSTQPDLKYVDQLVVIERIYTLAGQKPFSFQSYTIPYWSQQGWEYLFWYYGGQKYGYLPIAQDADQLFVIIQNDQSNKTFQNEWLSKDVNRWGSQTFEFTVGELRVLQLKTI